MGYKHYMENMNNSGKNFGSEGCGFDPCLGRLYMWGVRGWLTLIYGGSGWEIVRFLPFCLQFACNFDVLLQVFIVRSPFHNLLLLAWFR